MHINKSVTEKLMYYNNHKYIKFCKYFPCNCIQFNLWGKYSVVIWTRMASIDLQSVWLLVSSIFKVIESGWPCSRMCVVWASRFSKAQARPWASLLPYGSLYRILTSFPAPCLSACYQASCHDYNRLYLWNIRKSQLNAFFYNSHRVSSQ